MKKCDVCDKSLAVENGEGDVSLSFIVCVHIEVSSFKGSEQRKQSLQRIMGNYSLDKPYRVCYECYLKSLGVKP